MGKARPVREGSSDPVKTVFDPLKLAWDEAKDITNYLWRFFREALGLPAGLVPVLGAYLGMSLFLLAKTAPLRAPACARAGSADNELTAMGTSPDPTPASARARLSLRLRLWAGSVWRARLDAEPLAGERLEVLAYPDRSRGPMRAPRGPGLHARLDVGSPWPAHEAGPLASCLPRRGGPGLPSIGAEDHASAMRAPRGPSLPRSEPRAMRVPRGPGLMPASTRSPWQASASRSWPTPIGAEGPCERLEGLAMGNELKEPGQAGAGGASPSGAPSIPAIDACLGDEVFQSDRVSGEMAAIGALVLSRFTSELGPNGLLAVARRVFCAMHAVEVRQHEKATGISELFAKSPQ